MTPELIILKKKAVQNLVSTSIIKLPYYKDYEVMIEKRLFNCYLANQYIGSNYYPASYIALILLKDIADHILMYERQRLKYILNITYTDMQRLKYLEDYVI